MYLNELLFLAPNTEQKKLIEPKTMNLMVKPNEIKPVKLAPTRLCNATG